MTGITSSCLIVVKFEKNMFTDYQSMCYIECYTYENISKSKRTLENEENENGRS